MAAYPSPFGFGFTTSGNVLAFFVSEEFQGESDLNDDGDAEDVVLHVHDCRDGATTNLQLAGYFGWGFPEEYEDFLAFVVREASQGLVDLNGDGDVEDSVVHIYDVESREATNLRDIGFSLRPHWSATSGIWLAFSGNPGNIYSHATGLVTNPEFLLGTTDGPNFALSRRWLVVTTSPTGAFV